jgi:Lhr-like helicase
LQSKTYFTRIGLSATVAPLEEVAKFLVGYDIPKQDYRM